MSAAGYYPPGAYNDSSAPYNEPMTDSADVVARERLNVLVDTQDRSFIDWLYENDYIPFKQGHPIFDEDTEKALAIAYSREKFIREAFIAYYIDDVTNEVEQEYIEKYIS